MEGVKGTNSSPLLQTLGRSVSSCRKPVSQHCLKGRYRELLHVFQRVLQGSVDRVEEDQLENPPGRRVLGRGSGTDKWTCHTNSLQNKTFNGDRASMVL